MEIGEIQVIEELREAIGPADNTVPVDDEVVDELRESVGPADNTVPVDDEVVIEIAQVQIVDEVAEASGFVA